ncbi:MULTISPECIES: RidA family protein [Clostridium]|nr:MULTISPECIES: RidA family protein [Clostridium]ADK17061.1 predicted endoribonuclease L-PSP [Clostridium ljungdahlii DSM 13528]AGY76102.1 RidA family protein [Clostridium autoethanogenum DSM 10061]ALU36264.1 Endoribonuclease L-PSP [Clostridium autoethanogenum DSM 10061]OAA85173.1 Enamine/imine deaminase [Clostridium ljungdahlii DSM 13528]OVY48825.1 Enamine/imine deaminase [Clostridium autoethanogenum]
MNNIITKNAPAAIGPYSQGIIHGDLIFVSGQLPINPTTGNLLEGNIRDMTRQCMDNISAILKEAQSDINKIVKTTIFVADLNDFAEVNEEYATFFENVSPARSCVQVAALPKGARIEIEAIARK